MFFVRHHLFLSSLLVLSFSFQTLACVNRKQTVSDDRLSNLENRSQLRAKVTTFDSKIITAASASYTDVSAAIARANQGDTILVPAGSATWSQRLEITKPITLIGAGIGSTVITSAYRPSDLDRYKMNRENYLITYYPTDPSTTVGAPCRISGFTLNGGASSFGIILYNPTIYTQKYVRVDHVRVYNLWGRSSSDPYGGRPFQIWGEFFGVMDNCVIGEMTGTYITVDGVDAMWSTPGVTYDYGSANMFFFEDNTFYGDNGPNAYMVISSEMAARFCIRHNVFDGTEMTDGCYPLFDAHGNQPNAHNATMGVEIYENTIKNNYGVTFFDQRGGKALVYNNNVIMAAGSVWAKVREEYNDGAEYPEKTYKPPTNTAGQPQHPSDSYYWGNEKNDVASFVPYVSGMVDYSNTGDPYYYEPLAYKGIVPQMNREFWNEQDAFNGTTGIGIGLLSNRPATCTKGVAYWATDTKKLYKCTATNTWTAYYTPFIYPHPLRDEN
jgi:hypothetical protein